MSKKTKIIITIIFIAVIIVTVLFVINRRRKHNLEQYERINYNYFAVYSDNEKVGVVDKSRKDFN